MTQWIDSHAHIFTKETAGKKPMLIKGRFNSVETYTKGLQANRPAGTVIVDFSMA